MAGRNVAPAPTAKMFRNLRACLVCSIIKPHDVFRKEGCPNCDAFLQLTGSDEAIQECTSTVFEGVMNMVNPEESWVAKWQRLQSYVSGLYAVKVVGILPEDVITAMEDANVKYIPRDGSGADDDLP